MIDRFDQDIETALPGLAMRVQEQAESNDREDPHGCGKIDPSKYKDMFENPPTFEKAWNHPEPFQHSKWRAATNKEFSKM